MRSLNEAGYHSGMFGKNHLFLYDQLDQVWDELHEICLGNYDHHPKARHSHSAFTLEDNHPYNMTARLADEAMDFIGRHSDDPFFCWVNWQDPHPAFTCPEPYASMFDPAGVSLPPNWCRETEKKPRKLENWRVNSRAYECSEAEARQAIAMYMGQCRYVDDQVGRMIAYLTQTGRLENTLVVFMSDHGEFLGDFGVFHKLPLFYESLTRTPVIFRYPQGTVNPFVFDGLVEQVDLTPTILEALGVAMPQSMVGRSLHKQLLREDGRGRDTVLVEAGLQMSTPSGPIPGAHHRAPKAPNSHGPGAMVSNGRFKLSMYTDDCHELYDLKTDPFEEHNLYGQTKHLKIQMRLTETLMQRTLGAGVRAHGEWTADCIDMRENPPEARESHWKRAELSKGPLHSLKGSKEGPKLKPTIVEMARLNRKKNEVEKEQSGS